MELFRILVTTSRHALVASVGVVTVLLAGCSWWPQPGPVHARQTRSPLLAAARANRIDLFGDFGTGDGRGADWLGRASSALRRRTFTEVGADSDARLDAPGRRMVFASTRHNHQPDLYLKSVDGVAVTQLTSDPSADIQPVFSPDDTRIAFASDRSGNWDIWVMSADGGQPVQITDGVADEVHPSWSPDGSRLVYCSLPARGGQWELWITATDGASAKKFIGYGLFPEWSPVGETILFQRARERESRLFSIWTLTLVDGEPRFPTELAWNAHQALILPTWSPDGRQIAFTSVTESPPDDLALPSTGESLDIWVMSSDGRNKVRLTDGHGVNMAPAFAPDGGVFFTTRRSGQDNIWSVRMVDQGSREGDEQLTGKLRDNPQILQGSRLSAVRTGIEGDGL